MLRAVVQRTTGSTGVELTVTHGLAQVPDAWNVVHNSDTGKATATYGTRMPLASVLTNTVGVINSIQTNCTVTVTCIFYNGRLY